MSKILFAEDDSVLAQSARQFLESEHHTVELVTDGIEALERIRLYTYDLIILDWGLPGMAGIEVCRKFRDRGGTTPILILTGKSSIVEKGEGFASGADDYLTKPFDVRELSMRLRALQRRGVQITQDEISLGQLSINVALHTVRLSAAEIQLKPKEFAILEFLMRHPDQVFSMETLLERIWSSESDTTPDIIYTYMKTLRKKLVDPSGQCPIRNVYGVGYKIQTSAIL
jgi:DNA-binding response OmpR family regulator